MDRFYSLSYLWYSATAMIVVVGVGMAVSAITGKPYVNAFPYNKAGNVHAYKKIFLFFTRGWSCNLRKIAGPLLIFLKTELENLE